MLIDWVRSGRTRKYLALGQEVRTSLRSVRTPWPRAKYFPVRPSHSVNKYILFAGWEVRIVKNCDRGLENAAFSSPRWQFFTIRTDPKPENNLFIFSCYKVADKWVNATLSLNWPGLRAVYGSDYMSRAGPVSRAGLSLPGSRHVC